MPVKLGGGLYSRNMPIITGNMPVKWGGGLYSRNLPIITGHMPVKWGGGLNSAVATYEFEAAQGWLWCTCGYSML